MIATRKSATLGLVAVLLAAGCGLWGLHASAWDLGGRSPILNYDTAQYALAARELATHGRLETTFALPIELAKHETPPWPLAVLQPGLVVVEAAFFRVAALFGAGSAAPAARGNPLEPLTLVFPILCYLAIGCGLAFAALRLVGVERPAADAGAPAGPSLAPAERFGAGLAIGLAFLLDPEAQHFAMGGFTELPFTLGLLLALIAIATGTATRRPLPFGLMLGLAGCFRANMLWLAPALALAAAWPASGPRRSRVVVAALVGFAIPLVPWWIYKLQAFGSPGWDLTRFVLWDGVGGRTWFSLFHLPEIPDLPHGAEAVSLLTHKVLHNLPSLGLALSLGPRGLWIGALAIWLLVARRPSPLAAAGLAVLALTALGVLSTAASIPWLRYLFPARVLAEAAGALALWGLIARIPPASLGRVAARALRAGVAVIALGWGVWQTTQGVGEARAASRERGVPSAATLRDLASRLARETLPGESVMSNLGPALAWHADRPVVHLALTPADIDACRRRVPFQRVVLAFRGPGSAWPAWRELVERPDAARVHPEWGIAAERHWASDDGFVVVWLELAPLGPRLASAADAAAARGSGPWPAPPQGAVPAITSENSTGGPATAIGEPPPGGKYQS